MKQLFVISTDGSSRITAALSSGGAPTFYAWSQGDHTKDLTIGVIELADRDDPEAIIDSLEAGGVMWLPNHLANPTQTIAPSHAAALAGFGVLPTHTTAQAMIAVNSKAGFAPFKPKRF
jgi:hypothetical protein